MVPRPALAVWTTIVARAYPSGGGGGRSTAFAAMAEDSGPLVSTGLAMSTTFELPGFEVTDNLGVVYGLVVRSTGLVGGVAAAFRSIKRGEVKCVMRVWEDQSGRRHYVPDE